MNKVSFLFKLKDFTGFIKVKETDSKWVHIFAQKLLVYWRDSQTSIMIKNPEISWTATVLHLISVNDSHMIVFYCRPRKHIESYSNQTRVTMVIMINI